MGYMHEANAIAARLRSGERMPSRTGPRKAVAASVISLEVLAFMRQFFADNDQLPPMAVIARAFGWVSVQSAHEHLHKLARFGHIEKNAVGKWRFARGMNHE